MLQGFRNCWLGDADLLRCRRYRHDRIALHITKDAQDRRGDPTRPFDLTLVPRTAPLCDERHCEDELRGGGTKAAFPGRIPSIQFDCS